MDLQEILGKNIFIRFTEGDDGFVSTVRYGVLYRKTETWSVGTPEHTNVRLPVDDMHASQ